MGFEHLRKDSVRELSEKRAYEMQQRNAAAIAFVVLAEGGQIDATTASEQSALFAEWSPSISYTVGNLRRYNGTLYRCVQGHTSQAGWEPDKAASLWSATSDPAEPWPEWSQPRGPCFPQRETLDQRHRQQRVGAGDLRLDGSGGIKPWKPSSWPLSPAAWR